nr:hypothetical protein [uncultured Sphingomonas sp.]
MGKAVRLAALALVALPAVASAQSPSAPSAIVEAAADCWEATGASSVNVASLAAKGWKSSNLTDKDGKAVPTPLRFYSKATSSVMVMILPDGKSPACSVVSRVENVAAYKPVMDQLQARLKQLEPGLKAGRSGTNGAAFLGVGRMAVIEPTGSQEQPSVRFIVSAQTAAKSGR